MDGSDNPNGGWLTRATPENQQETAKRDPQRPYANHLAGPRDEEMVHAPRRRGGSSSSVVQSWKKLDSSEIPCRVERNLPLERAISQEIPANNGETLVDLDRAIPWEVESLRLFDPVTTEAKAEMEFLSQDKSLDSIRRRPSDNSRIDIPSYVSGYVDGEGCFCVSLRPQPRIRIGWEVRPSFSVSQNDDRSELIKLLPTLFGCGSIRPDRSDRTLKFEIRSLKDLLSNVIPFFETYPLLSSKRRDFELFQRICSMMELGEHLESEGVVLIAELAQRMNSGVRKYSADVVKATVQR